MDINQIAAPKPPRTEPTVEEKRGERAEGPKISVAERTRKELNAAIIQSASEVSLSAGNQPLHLLYRAAIDELNEVLEADLGPNAIQKAAEKPEDFTPEATANRILSFATGFYARYAEHHPEMEEEERLDKFLELIGGGIDQGFKEARDILEGLEVLGGAVKEGVDKTYDLIQQGLQSFRDSILGKEEETSEGEGEGEKKSEGG